MLYDVVICWSVCKGGTCMECFPGLLHDKLWSLWCACVLCLRYMRERELYESCMVTLERHSRKSRWSSCFPACCTGSMVLSFSPRQARLRRHSGAAVDVTSCDWLTAAWRHWQLLLASATCRRRSPSWWQPCPLNITHMDLHHTISVYLT